MAKLSSEDVKKIEFETKLLWELKRKERDVKEQRRKFDWQWVVRNLYARGYHFANYNRGTNTIVFANRSGVQIPINLVGAHMRGVSNQITSFDPKWEVLPNMTTTSAFQNARYSGRTLDYIYEKAQIKRKIKEIVHDSLLTSIGIWHFDTDRNKNIVISRVDPLDFWVDGNIKSPNISDPEYGAEFVIMGTQTSLDAIKKNKKYNYTTEIQADNQIAAAEYKQFLLQVSRNQLNSSADVSPTVILKQALTRERDEEGDIKLRVTHYIDQFDRPLYTELTDDAEYPFEIMQGDIAPGELYAESWIKHLIPINRVIDALESHIFEYNHFFAKGKWIVDKNSGVRIIINQNGQIIEKNRGSTVTAVTVPPLPPNPENQIARMKSHFEDLSGVHDSSMGRMPVGIRSGTAIAELKAADASNQSNIIDNLEDFLSRSGRKILKLVSENWTTSRLLTVTGMGGAPEYFMAVGEKSNMKKKSTYKMGEKELPLAVIGSENEVRVKVGSWLAYTKEARQEKLKEYFRLGAIDQKTFLAHAEFGDIDGIMERTRQERVFSSYSGSKSQAVEREYGIQLDDEALAMAENEIMLEGTPQHAQAGDNHELHRMVHEGEKDIPLVAAHIKEHDQFEKWQSKMNSTPVPQGTGVVPAPNGMSGGLPPEMGGQIPQLGGTPSPETFQMNPVRGAGAPPFNPNQDIIQGGF